MRCGLCIARFTHYSAECVAEGVIYAVNKVQRTDSDYFGFGSVTCEFRVRRVSQHLAFLAI